MKQDNQQQTLKQRKPCGLFCTYDFFRKLRIRINDMSLPMGGLFDIGGDWRPNPTDCATKGNKKGHCSHRNGINADIEFFGMADNGQCSERFTETQRNVLRVIIQLVTRELYPHGDHFHTKRGQ